MSFLQVKHFLQHTFGIPYAENYYAGDWMLGPDLFCWQPICNLGYSINAYAYHVKPKTYDDVQLVVDTLKNHKTSIDRYRYSQCFYLVPAGAGRCRIKLTLSLPRGLPLTSKIAGADP